MRFLMAALMLTAAAACAERPILEPSAAGGETVWAVPRNSLVRVEDETAVCYVLLALENGVSKGRGVFCVAKKEAP